jgi:hypothetical protein
LVRWDGNDYWEVAEMYGFQSAIISADIITQYLKYWPFNEIGKEYYHSRSRGSPTPQSGRTAPYVARGGGELLGSTSHIFK